MLERAGELAFASDELDVALERLEQSRALYLEAGRTHDAARAAVPLCTALWALARIDDAVALAEPALDVLAADEPDEDVARLAAEVARLHFFRGELEPALARVEQSLAIAEAQRLPQVLSQALNTKSLVIRAEHPREARALIREALDVALESDLVDAALRAYNNLAVNEWEADRREESRRMALDGFEFARRRGHRHYVVSFACWEIAVPASRRTLGRRIRARGRVPRRSVHQSGHRCDRSDLPRERGAGSRRSRRGRRRLGLIAPEVLDSTDLQNRSSAFMHEAVSALDEGRAADALRSCRALIENEFTQDSPQGGVVALRWASTVAREHGLFDELAALVERVDDIPEFQRTREVVGEHGRARGVVATHAGDEDAALDAFGVGLAAARSAGDRWLTGEILTDYGRALVSFGRPEEADSLLDEARELWTSMGAARWLERVEDARRSAEVRA